MPDLEKLEGYDENLPVTHHNEYVRPHPTQPFILTLRTTPQRIPRDRSAAAIRHSSVPGQSCAHHRGFARNRTGNLAAVRSGGCYACDNGARGGRARGD